MHLYIHSQLTYIINTHLESPYYGGGRAKASVPPIRGRGLGRGRSTTARGRVVGASGKKEGARTER